MGGWVAKHATAFESPSLGEISILRFGPKEVGKLFNQDVLALTEMRADAAVRTRLGDDDGPGVWWEGLRAIIGNRYVTPLTRHILVSTTCGTYMTRSLAHKWGYLPNARHAGISRPGVPAVLRGALGAGRPLGRGARSVPRLRRCKT